MTLGAELVIIGAIAYQVHFPEESRHTGDIDFAAGPKLREAKQVTWPISQFTMSLVGFDHVFTTAQPVPFDPDLTLKVISSTALTLLKIVAFMDDQQRRVKDLDDIRGLLVQYEADSERLFSDVVINAALQDYGLRLPC